MVSGDFSYVQLAFPRFVDQDGATALFRVIAEAAPWLLLRFEDQSALHWIAMHVA
jgi:hypothetical protein